jgi:hypothetical protein
VEPVISWQKPESEPTMDLILSLTALHTGQLACRPEYKSLERIMLREFHHIPRILRYFKTTAVVESLLSATG